MEKNCSRIGARVVPKNLSDSLVLLGDLVYRSLHVGFYSKQNPVFHIHNYELSFELSYISSRPKILYKHPHPTWITIYVQRPEYLSPFTPAPAGLNQARTGENCWPDQKDLYCRMKSLQFGQYQ